MALNDERFEPGAGYGPHEHRDLDIVTWVLEGTLAHEDSSGRREVLSNGTVQRLTAGTGICHSEVNAGGPGESLRMIQLWFRPAPAGGPGEPSYETWTLEDDDWFGLTAIAGSITPRRSATLTVPGVTVRVGHLARDARARYGSGAHGPTTWQLYVADGCLDLGELGRVETGDTVRWNGPGRAHVDVRSIDDAVVIAVELDEFPKGR